MDAKAFIPIVFYCPQCRQRMTADADEGGGAKDCPKCGNSVLIERGSAPPSFSGAGSYGGAHRIAATSQRAKRGNTALRIIGMLVFFCGLLAVFSFVVLFDTTVKTDNGEFVHNIGLLQERTTGTIVSALAVIVGLAVWILGELIPRPE